MRLVVVVLALLGIAWLLWDRDPATVARRVVEADRVEADRAEPPAATETIAPIPDRSHTVVDKDGNPIEGVRVVWEAAWQERETRTDARGQFDCTAKKITLEYHRKGYARREAWVRERRVVLQPERRFSGIVVDTDGSTVNGVPLNIHVTEYDGDSYWNVDAVSGDGGRFEIDRLPAGRIEINVWSDGWRSAEGGYRGFTGQRDARIAVVGRAALLGRVVDSGGKPIVGADVIDAADDYIGSSGRPGKIENEGSIVSSDKAGAFRISGKIGETKRVFAQFEGRRSPVRPIQLAASPSSSPVELRISDAITHRSFVRIRVVDPGGRPVPDAEIRWSRRAFLPPASLRNADGTAALPAMPQNVVSYSASYLYTPQADSDERGEFEFDVPLPPGTGMEFYVAPEGELLPMAVTAISQSRGDLQVTLAQTRRGVLRRVRCISDNSEMNSLLEIGGPCTCVGSKSDDPRLMLFDPSVRYHVSVDRFFGVTVLDAAWTPPATDTLTTFRVANSPSPEPESETTPSTLRVTGTRGQPLPDASCRPLIPGAQGHFLVWWDPVLANEHGVIKVGGSEHRFLYVSAPDHATVAIRSDATTVQLPEAARMEVRMSFPGRFRPADWRLEVQPESWPSPAHRRCRLLSAREIWWGNATWDSMYEQMYRFGSEQTVPSGVSGTIHGLPAGPCRVRLWTSNFEEIVHVDLRAGETTTAVFRGR